MTPFSAVYDACVLYPAPLRDLLMHLALTGLFRARWSDEIHEEWIRNLLKNRPDLTQKQLERTRDLMNQHAPDCLVTGYQDLVKGLTLPDPYDCHVLAAAIRSGSSVIVTYNLKDFPCDYLTSVGIEAQHPDEFIAHLIDLSPGQVCQAAQRHHQSLQKPPMSTDQYLDRLAKQNLPDTVSRLSKFKHAI